MEKYINLQRILKTMKQSFKKRFVFLLAVAVILMFIISACQDNVVGKTKGKKGDTGGTGGGGTSCIDNDLDGYGAGCPQGPDCNDNNANMNTGALEICDGVDNDCDGLVNEGWTFDVDSDGYSSLTSCEGSKDDCNDNNAAINPLASEVCDSVDNDCNGLIDEGLTFDVDSDGYSSLTSCSGSKDDCNDTNVSINPLASEVCDSVDNNCDGLIDEGNICAPPCVPSEFRVTNIYLSIPLNPAIYGDRIVWQDNRNGNNDIYMYNITAGTETRITTNTASQQYPDIYGDRIVWQDNRNGNNDLYMYNITAGTETRITTNSLAQLNPAIYGDRIVWRDNRNGNWDIYMYDLAAGTETRITTNTAGQYYPDIYGDRIVWQDLRSGNWVIYMYNITAGTETRITTNTASQQYPDIYGDRIVWQDGRNGNNDIYMYDLAAGTETRITTNTAEQQYPAIYGDRIVWQDGRNGNNDIYMYDLAAGTETRITTNTAEQQHPAIYGDRIVLEDNRNGGGNPDIYMYTLCP